MKNRWKESQALPPQTLFARPHVRPAKAIRAVNIGAALSATIQTSKLFYRSQLMLRPVHFWYVYWRVKSTGKNWRNQRRPLSGLATLDLLMLALTRRRLPHLPRFSEEPALSQAEGWAPRASTS